MHKRTTDTKNQSRNIHLKQDAYCTIVCSALHTRGCILQMTGNQLPDILQRTYIADCHVHQMHRMAPNEWQCSLNANIKVAAQKDKFGPSKRRKKGWSPKKCWSTKKKLVHQKRLRLLLRNQQKKNAVKRMKKLKS